MDTDGIWAALNAAEKDMYEAKPFASILRDRLLSGDAMTDPERADWSTVAGHLEALTSRIHQHHAAIRKAVWDAQQGAEK
jgi:hypothetical protein